MRRIEFAVRLLLIYIAGALSAVDEDGWLTAPFAIASIFFTAELASRRPGRDGMDRTARMAGSVIVAMVLGGLVLNLIPAGLTRKTWSALWVVLSLAVLWWKRNERTSLTWLRRKPSSTTAWFAASAVIVVLATVVATEGANRDLRSPTEMWLQGKSPGSITVAVSSGTAGGPYRIIVEPMVTKTDAFDPFVLDPDRPVERPLPVAGNTRYTIHLVDDQSGEQLRTLIVDSPPL